MRTLTKLIAAALALALLAATPAFAAEKLRIVTTGGKPPFTHVDNAGGIAAFAPTADFLLLPPLLMELDQKKP